LQVAGVYVRLFVANPGWLLRRPKQFLTELMDFLLQQMRQSPDQLDKSKVELLSKGALALLSAQPALMELLPAMGYVPTFLDALQNSTRKPGCVTECCVRLLEQ